jgi:L-asparaginase II
MFRKLTGKHAGFECMDCHKDTWDEYYMVYSSVWKKANPKFTGKLCITCLETRLGRKLKAKDFTKRSVNTLPMKRSKKLTNRLGILQQ